MFDKDFLVKVGENQWLEEESKYLFFKDESGQWWVVTCYGGFDRGPFNTLEHACECAEYIYEREGAAV